MRHIIGKTCDHLSYAPLAPLSQREEHFYKFSRDLSCDTLLVSRVTTYSCYAPSVVHSIILPPRGAFLKFSRDPLCDISLEKSMSTYSCYATLALLPSMGKIFL